MASIKDFNNTFSSHISDEEVNTIGGLLVHACSHLPTRDESINIDGYQFKVTISDSQRIINVNMRIPDDSSVLKLAD